MGGCTHQEARWPACGPGTTPAARASRPRGAAEGVSAKGGRGRGAGMPCRNDRPEGVVHPNHDGKHHHDPPNRLVRQCGHARGLGTNTGRLPAARYATRRRHRPPPPPVGRRALPRASPPPPCARSIPPAPSQPPPSRRAPHASRPAEAALISPGWGGRLQRAPTSFWFVCGSIIRHSSSTSYWGRRRRRRAAGGGCGRGRVRGAHLLLDVVLARPSRFYV